MLIKIYGADQGETRYSPAECIGCRTAEITGKRDPAHVSTSFAERQNLSVRLSIRRYTRLTSPFSRKIENHAAAVALYCFTYNFIKTTARSHDARHGRWRHIAAMGGVGPCSPAGRLRTGVRNSGVNLGLHVILELWRIQFAVRELKESQP